MSTPTFSRRILLSTSAAALGLAAFPQHLLAQTLVLSEDEWRARLTPNQFSILREGMTEPEEFSPLHLEDRAGLYHCVGCATAIYSSQDKYASGTGWPAFTKSIPGAITTADDTSNPFFVQRAVSCATCGGHQGHIFDDGPEPLGDRHCINGTTLDFRPA